MPVMRIPISGPGHRCELVIASKSIRAFVRALCGRCAACCAAASALCLTSVRIRHSRSASRDCCSLQSLRFLRFCPSMSCRIQGKPAGSGSIQRAPILWHRPLFNVATLTAENGPKAFANPFDESLSRPHDATRGLRRAQDHILPAVQIRCHHQAAQPSLPPSPR